MVRENINNLHILKEIKCKIEMIKLSIKKIIYKNSGKN
jgi:hypothetical protein